jgi:hypothetical protein
MLFQKRIVCTKLDIYVFEILKFDVIYFPEECRQNMGFGETLCDGIDLDFMEDGNSDEETWIRYANTFNTD